MKILIIQILRMGDALQLLPILRALKGYFPEARVSVLTSTLGGSVLQGRPEIDRVFVLRKETIVQRITGGNGEGPGEALALLQEDLGEVLEDSWDWVVNFGYTFSSALLSYLAQGRHRSGFSANGKRQYLAKEPWFTFFLASFVHRRYSCFNWVDVNRKVIGLPRVPPPPSLLPGEQSLAAARRFIGRAGLEGKRIVALHPGASGEHKRWPVEHFAALGRRLTQEGGCGLLVLGGPGEREIGRRLKELVGAGVEDLTGGTSLEELGGCLSLCDWLVTNDTGPMHLAAALGKRVLSLFFSTHFVETGPYGQGHICIHPALPCFPCQGTGSCRDRRCLEAIPPEAVYEVMRTRDGPGESPGSNRWGVRVLASRFDPWGFLDWVPVDRAPLDLQTLERLLLRVSCIAFAEGGDPDGPVREETYLREMLAAHTPPADGAGLREGLRRLLRELGGYRALVEGCCLASMEIQTRCLRRELSGIEPLGGRLSRIEQELASMGGGSSIGFLSEWLTLMRENIEAGDGLDLATKTLGVYRDALQFSDLMLRRGHEMAARLGLEG